MLSAVEGWGHDGPVALVGTERRVSVDDAIYGAAALSMALDFDDYVCFGHTGHSGVLVSLLLAASTSSPAAEQLVAQTIANEVEARLGGACLVGPLNGQLWSFIHVAGAALAAGRLLGLDASRMAHALAIALYQAPRATVPGFMAPDSKLLTAAEPTAAGVRAARLAAAGVTGPLDTLEHAEGFLTAFADAPLPGMLGGLGEGWLVAGELTPGQVSEEWLAAHADELRSVASRVRVHHDWSLTRLTTEAFAGLIPFGRVAGEAGLRRLGASVRARRGGGRAELRGLQHMFWPPPDLTTMRSRRPFWDPASVDAFAMTFPARVRVIANDGSERVAECARPRGGAGNTVEGPEPVSRAKLAAYGPWLWGDDGTESIAKAIDADADDLWRRL